MTTQTTLATAIQICICLCPFFEQQINRDEPKNAATLTKRQLKQSIAKLIDDQDEMKRQLKQHW
jgi:hypothetical protein